MASFFTGKAKSAAHIFSMLKNRGANKDGAVAVEFAMLLPILITLFFGVVELSLALVCRADVSMMASTAADLISQGGTISTADVNNVYSASGTILYPYYNPATSGSAKPTIRLTSVVDDGSGAATGSKLTGTVAWSCTQSGSGTLTPASRTPGSTVTLPQPLMTEGGSVIIAEIAYGYASPTTQVITGPINMTNNFYTKPRRVFQIAAPSGGCP
ncbi:MAG TPA: TadE/TadG family type IV pilus assembly protein [Rhizomicrobium sp.]|nr:TadE/TadG family type IV pilus assembly protein [Rhizomicrobium sp.]